MNRASNKELFQLKKEGHQGGALQKCIDPTPNEPAMVEI
jgi:hypothetical protein